MFTTPPSFDRIAPLYGLVLAGGFGTRMGGMDKGELVLHGEPQVRWLVRLLRELCEQVHVSVRVDQTSRPVYDGLPLIVDETAARGPAMGLHSAMRLHPEAAWLVIAVDMASVDRAALEELVAARNSRSLATAFLHPDGVAEPLCAIWEPSAIELIAQALASHRSLRRLLEGTHLVRPSRPNVLASVNSPGDVASVRQSEQAELVAHRGGDY